MLLQLVNYRITSVNLLVKYYRNQTKILYKPGSLIFCRFISAVNNENPRMVNFLR